MNDQAKYEAEKISIKMTDGRTRSYIKPSTNLMLAEILKKEAGNFINILANRLSMKESPAKITTISFWG